MDQGQSSPSVEPVLQALKALYSPDTNPTKQREASEWLVQYQQQPAAWGVAGILIRHPALEAQMYAASTLHSKASLEWPRLSPEQRTQFQHQLITFLRDKSSSSQAYPAVLSKLSLTIALIAVRTIHGCTSLIRELLTMSEHATSLVYMILAAIPDQISTSSDLTYDRRTDVLSELNTCLPDILRMCHLHATHIHTTLTKTSPSDTSTDSLLKSLITMLQSWIPLQLLTPGELYDTQVIQPLCIILSIQHPPRIQILLPLFTELLEIERYPKENHHDDAIQLICQHLITLRPILDVAQHQRSADEFVRILAECTTAMSSNYTWIARGSDIALALVEMQLILTRHVNRAICETSLEFWHRLQDVPVNERHPSLAQPVYIKVLQILVTQSAFPADFNKWQPNGHGFAADKDAFTRYRGIVMETLFACFYILQDQYITLLCQAMQQPNISWHILESLLWCLSSVAAEVRDVSTPTTRTLIDQQLGTLFTSLLSSSAISAIPTSHPQLIITITQLIRAYAPWLAQHSNLTQQAVNYLMSCATVTHHAGGAFQRLCDVCGPIWSQQPQSISALLDFICSNDRLISSTIPLRTRCLIINGLATTISHVPISRSQDASQLLQMLCAPQLQLCKQALSYISQHQYENQARNMIYDGLSMLATMMEAQRWSPEYQSTYHPAMSMYQSYHELLIHILKIWSTDTDIVTLILRIYECAIDRMKSQMLPVLQQILTQTLAVYQSLTLPQGLDVFGVSVALISGHAHAITTFSAALATLYKHTLATTRQDGIKSHVDLITSFYKLCYICIQECPTVIIANMSNLLPHIFQLSVSVMDIISATDCLRSIFHFYHGLHRISSTDDTININLQTTIEEQGQAVVRTIIHGMVDSTAFPLEVIKDAGLSVLAFMKRYPELMRSWLVKALSQDYGFPVELADQHKEMFLTCLWALHTTPSYRALWDDFVTICRSSSPNDTAASTLLAYQIQIRERASRGTRPRKEIDLT